MHAIDCESPVRPNSASFASVLPVLQIAICGGSDYELVINFENALGRLYIRYFLRALG